jgi:hypothetical protein
VAHVEAPFAFFQVQVKRLRRDPVELLQAMVSKAPEALDAIDMVCAPRELVLPMIDSVMLRVADIDQAVIAAPPIAMNHCLRRDATANNGLKRGFRAIGHDLRIDLAVSLQQPKDRSLATGSATALAANTASAKVTFINFHFAGKWRNSFAFFGDTLTNLEKDHRDSFTPDAGQLRDIRGRKIHREVAQQLAEFTLGNSGTRVIAVSSFHLSSLALAV